MEEEELIIFIQKEYMYTKRLNYSLESGYYNLQVQLQVFWHMKLSNGLMVV